MVRRAWEPDTLPDEARERFLEWIEPWAGLEGIDAAMRIEVTRLGRAEAMRRSRDPEGPPLLAFAEALPAFIGLEVAEDGHLWVRLPQTVEELMSGHPAQLRTDRWNVFDPEGRWLGTVETPPELEVRAFGDGWVAGIWRDALDVDYVRFHRLMAPP